ncbi:MAG: recombinase family protein [Clostridiales bacterium]|nr:recombinase family protein [Clostridiales bacterium]
MTKNNVTFEPEMQSAVIYARYSSHAQRDCSIEQQVAECEDYARRNNLRVVKVYADRHLTGTTDKRPEFQKMLRDSARTSWQYVICWKIDRFARNRYDSATYKYRLKKNGVKVLYAKESIPDGPEGILLEAVLEGSAEYYSANLSQNIRRGMLYNAQECKINNGAIPFGYCKGEDGRFAVNEPEAEIVREIFQSVANSVPFVDIANNLNGRGVKTKRGGRWNKNSFHRILHNENYIGVYHYADVRIENGVPAIVDVALFEQVNKILKKKKAVRGRHQKNGDYLLTGKLKCAHCGSFMVGMSGVGKCGEKYYYYACQGKRTGHICQKKNVRREWIERFVVQATLDYVLQPKAVEWIADCVMAYQEKEASSASLALLRQQKAENEKALANVMKAIEAGIITATTKRRLTELEAEGAELDRSIKVEEASHVHLEREQVIYFLERFQNGSLESQEFRRKVIDTFVSVIYLSDDHLKIGFNYSGKNSEVDASLVLDAESIAGPESSYSFSQSPPQETPTIVQIVGVFVLIVLL